MNCNAFFLGQSLARWVRTAVTRRFTALQNALPGPLASAARRLQNSKQMLESSALDSMVGCEQRDQRSGDVADEVTEGGIDTKPMELAETESAPNKIAHSLAP